MIIMKNKMWHIYTIQRKPIKSLRIKVLPDESVVVSAPRRLSESYVNKFIEERRGWIEKAIEKMKKAKRGGIVVKENEILLFGDTYTFTHDPKMKRKVLIDHELATIASWIDLMNKVKQKAWYKSYAKDYLTAKAKELSKIHNLPYEKTYIRDQKTKWGTCSSKKNIGLNRKLIKTPEDIIEYVICHELAHLREMNHSQRFWTVVEEIYPNYKSAVAWMKKYGMSLQ